MKLNRKIKLNENIYYILIELEYKKNDNNINCLCLKNYKDTYFDNGNLSKLLLKISQNYNKYIEKKYDDDISYLDDCLYIYNRIPFLSGIYDTSSDEVLPNSFGYISKNELDKYIKDNNVKMLQNDKFNLCDERTWII